MRRRKLAFSRGARAAGLGLALSVGVFACSGWDPRAPFEHNSPEVEEALKELDSGRVQPAEDRLERYLETGPCSADGGLQLPPGARKKPNGGFDLGLTLFSIGEQFGQRFGDEERSDGGSQREQALADRRSAEVACALLIARAIAADTSLPADLRARAFFLAGNLEFLLKKYEDAVKEYDQALGIIPGLDPETGGDGIGRDAAWNRAIALRRIEDNKDAGDDAADNKDGSDHPDGSDGSDGKDGGKDAGDDGGKDGGDDGGKDGGDKGDAGNDGGGQDAGNDGGKDEDGGNQPNTPPPPASASPSASPQQDQRILEQLEQAPSYQGQEAKQRAANRKGRPTMEDK